MAIDSKGRDTHDQPTHLLALRGGSACGEVTYSHITPEINDVTCVDCLKAHEIALQRTSSKAN